MLEVEVVFRIFVPWQLQNSLEVTELHRVVGRLRVEPLQLLHLFLKGLGYSRAPLLHASLFAELIDFDLLGVATQLLLDGSDLLLQEILLLLLVEVLPGLHLDVHLQLQDLRLAVEDHQQTVGLLLLVADAEQLLLLPTVDGQVGAAVTDQHVGEGFAQDGLYQLLGRFAQHLQHVYHRLTDGVEDRMVLLVIFLCLDGLHQLVRALHIGRFLCEFLPLEPFLCLDDDAQVVVSQFDHADHLCQDTHAIEVIAFRIFYCGIFLTHQSDVALFLAHGADQRQ